MSPNGSPSGNYSPIPYAYPQQDPQQALANRMGRMSLQDQKPKRRQVIQNEHIGQLPGITLALFFMSTLFMFTF